MLNKAIVLTPQQRCAVDSTGWHSAGVTLDFALDRLDTLEEVLQDVVVCLTTVERGLFEGKVSEDTLIALVSRLRKTLTDALRE